MGVSKTIAFLPFRSGSKGILDKNIKHLLGKSLYKYALDATVAVKELDQIIIGTDYPQAMFTNYLKEDSRVTYWDRTGTKGISDTASTELAIEEMVLALGITPDTNIILVQVTNPFIDSNIIDRAIGWYKGTGTLFSVVPFDRYLWGENKDLVYYEKREIRQDMKSMYLENGALYIFNIREFLESGDRMNKPLDFIEMKKESIFEIDDNDDWNIIEKLIRF